MHHVQASYPDYQDWRLQSKALEQTATYTAEGLNRSNLNTNGVPIEVQMLMVSGNLLRMLGIQPVLGRNFDPGETQAGRENVILISQALWKSRFGADPHVIGRQVSLDDATMRITAFCRAPAKCPLGPTFLRRSPASALSI